MDIESIQAQQACGQFSPGMSTFQLENARVLNERMEELDRLGNETRRSLKEVRTHAAAASPQLATCARKHQPEC